MLPIGVIIPTRNSMAYLPGHLQSVSEWCDVVEQVVVVDSESTDGTVDYLKGHLSHKNLKIFSRPPGLYDAWNFGISQIKSKYTYISTVGDRMTAEGLHKLHHAAEQFQTDVVLSPPRLVDMQGNVLAEKSWPVQLMIERFHIDRPSLLSSADALCCAVTSGDSSIMGSSASNLYRTATLQASPFPNDYFHAGDMAWGIMNSWKCTFTVVPESFSTFLFHPKEHREAPGQWTKMSRLAEETVRLALARRPELRSNTVLCQLAELLKVADEHAVWEQRLQNYRRQKIPWIVNPRVWTTRVRRNEIKRRMDELKGALKKHILVELIPPA